MKKITKLGLSALIVLSAGGVVGLTSCSSGNGLKVGLICLHDKNSTYDNNFISEMQNVKKKMGFKLYMKTGVSESADCYDTACELAEKGCDIIISDSFGHQDYMIEAAKKYSNVQFVSCTGSNAKTSGLANYQNAFASIYEGRYLAGVTAGLKLQAMLAADPSTSKKIGYVGAYPYAEVVSGYTSYFLGVRSIVSDVTMDVRFTNSWYDIAAEKETANTLIQSGCSIISQHADSSGAPTACEEAGVPNVSYNMNTKDLGPTTYLVASRINWAPYYEYAIGQVQAAKDAGKTAGDAEIDTNWTGTMSGGSVELLGFGSAAADGTEAKVNAVKEKLVNGTLNVFDCSTFTVTKTESQNVNAEVDEDGHLINYKADTDGDYAADTFVVENGVFMESKYCSAPYFDVLIDGITQIF